MVIIKIIIMIKPKIKKTKERIIIKEKKILCTDDDEGHPVEAGSNVGHKPQHQAELGQVHRGNNNNNNNNINDNINNNDIIIIIIISRNDKEIGCVMHEYIYIFLYSSSLFLTPPHSSSLLLTPPHSSLLLLTPPHSSSLLLTPP